MIGADPWIALQGAMRGRSQALVAKYGRDPHSELELHQQRNIIIEDSMRSAAATREIGT